MTSPSPAFARLVSPIDKEDFFRSYWEQLPLHLWRDAPDYYEDLLTVDDVDRYFQSQHLSHHFLGVLKNGEYCPQDLWTAIKQHGGSQAFRVVDVSKLLKLFNEGATIVINNSETAIPSLTSFSRKLASELKCPMQANLYVTPRNAQGFSPHFDTHNVFIMQIHGCKQWRLYDYENREPRQTLDLRPGDLLYIPRGTVHAARSEETASIHITLSPLVKRWSYLLHLLARQANETPAFRRLLPHALSAESERTGFAEEFIGELQTLLRQVDLPSLHYAQFVEEQPVDGPGRFTDLLKAERLTVDSIVRLRPCLNFLIDRDEEWVTIRFDATELVLPVFLAPAVDFLLSNETFAVRDIDGIPNGGGKLAFVRRFIRAGLLTVVLT